MKPTREQPYELPDRVGEERSAAAGTLLLGFAVSLLLAAVFYTQQLAHHFDYDPSLGSPWISHHPLAGPVALTILCLAVWRAVEKDLSLFLILLALAAIAFQITRGGFYGPWDGLAWWNQHKQHDQYRAIQAPYFDQAVIAGLLIACIFLLRFFIRVSGLKRYGDTQGSARFATPEEVQKSPLASGQMGVVLGRHKTPDGRMSWLMDASGLHTLLVAPPGSGKSTCIFIPTLFVDRRSTLVFDVKGELWHATAGYRSKTLEHRCLRYNPTSEDYAGHVNFNPFDLIPRGPSAVTRARRIAQALVAPTGREHASEENVWIETATQLLTASILHVLYAEPDKSLPGLSHFLASPERSQIETLELMLRTEHDHEIALGPHPTIGEAATYLRDAAERTRTSVFFQAMAALSLYSDPVIARYCRSSDFHPHDLVDPKKPTTLYITIPPSRLKAIRNHLRLVLQMTVSTLTDDSTVVSPGAERAPLLLALDEFNALGRVDFMSQMLAYLRGYRISVLAALQNMAQLRETYGTNESLSPNFSTLVAFRPADHQTAEYLSRRMGHKTVYREGLSHSSSYSLAGKSSKSRTVQEQRRSLLTPDETSLIPRDAAFIFQPGLHPVLADTAPFDQFDEFLERSKIAPPAALERAPVHPPWQDATPSVPYTLEQLREDKKKAKAKAKAEAEGPPSDGDQPATEEKDPQDIY